MQQIKYGHARMAFADAKTFVLIHGAWHGGWCWRRVSDRLRASGHKVFTPTLTGLGARAHLVRSASLETFRLDIVGLIEAEELERVILVGHSFGGLVATMVADRLPQRLQCLVYLDAVVGEAGKSAFDALPAAVVAQRLRAAQETSGGISFPVPPPQAFGVTDPSDQAWLRAHLTPHPLASYTDRLTLDHPVGNGLRKIYIAATAPEYAPLAATRAAVRMQPDWDWREIAAGHDAMVTAPHRLAEMLEAIG
jgi:pimeloyl-ACP methyl ester carboxylesterase